MKTIISLTVAIASFAAGMAYADDSVPFNEGWRGGIGGAYIHINSKADDFSGQFTPSGLGLEVHSTSTLFLSLSKRVSDHIDLELLGGMPPTHDVYAKGPAQVPFPTRNYDGVKIGSSKQLAPTFIVNYSFFDKGTAFRPYFGLGLNYTHFYDQKTTAAGDNINGGPTKIQNTDSIGPAGQIGLRYNFPSRWSLNASLTKAIVSSHLTATTGGVDRTTTIYFNPLVSVVSLEYAY